VTKVVIVIYKINHYFLDLQKEYKFKRVVSDKDLGPIVKTVMTSAYTVPDVSDLLLKLPVLKNLVFSVEEVKEVGTYVDRVLSSELSGNVIDLCPVGALTKKAKYQI
jgi:NADH-quinone oxidoreductase subunit G